MWQRCVVVGQCPGLPGLMGVPARRSPKANSYHPYWNKEVREYVDKCMQREKMREENLKGRRI
jgi:hypothetical protein